MVLTFDDGPAGDRHHGVNALARECILATFFRVGKGSQVLPGMVKKIAAGGQIRWDITHGRASTLTQ